MTAQSKPTFPSMETLQKKYGSYIKSVGVKRLVSWNLPNSAEETQEEEIYDFAQKDDVEGYISAVDQALDTNVDASK